MSGKLVTCGTPLLRSTLPGDRLQRSRRRTGDVGGLVLAGGQAGDVLDLRRFLHRHDGERVIALRHPLLRGGLHVGRGGFLVPGVELLPRIGAAEVQRAFAQARGLAERALEAADGAGAILRLQAREFVLRRAFGEEFLPLLGDRGFHLLRIHALLHVGGEHELAGQFERRDIDLHVVDELVLVDQALVQARGLAAAHHAGGVVEHHEVALVARRDVPFAIDARLRDGVFHRSRVDVVRGATHCAWRVTAGPAAMSPKYFCDLRLRGRRIDVAG
jgi:hypothetical protein